MKYLLILMLCAGFTLSQAQSNLSSEEWRQDLEYLQNLVHTKYEPLFYRITKEEFDEEVKALHAKIPNLERHEIIVGFAKIAALFKYGHMGMPLAYAMHGEELKTGFSLIPVNFYHFSDGVFIQAAHKDFQQAAGAKVLRIGNKSVEEALEAIRPTVSIENEQFFKAYGIGNLAIPEVLHAVGITKSKDNVSILLEKDGQQFTIDFEGQKGLHIPGHYGFVFGDENWVTMSSSKEVPIYLKNLRENYRMEFLQDSKTLYIRQSQINDHHGESITQFYNRVSAFVEHNSVEKLVLDLRINGGGNNYKNKPIILSMIKSSLNQKGKLFTIIGRRTFSAAQNLVNELEKYTNTTFIGEPTAESINFFGDVNVETLPNSQLTVRLSFMWWQDNDPRDTREWTTPEIFVDLSSTDYINGKDPVLDAVIDYRSYAYELMASLRSHYQKKEYALAVKLTEDFFNDPKTQYTTIRNQMNALGYEYINSDIKTALEIFKLNVKLYPKCANCWDSLGEAYFTAGDFKKSIENYQKAVDLEPTSPTGIRAKEVIQRIKAHSGN